MTNNDQVGSDQTPAQPSPQLQAVPGYQTSSGQLTALFALVATVLSLLGFHYSPEQVSSWVELVNKMAVTLGPLLALVPILWNYITSRGKIASNTLVANAQVLSSPRTKGEPLMATAQFAGGLGGLNFKDPATYGTLIHIASELGVPGVTQADAINQKIHVDSLITGILGMLHHKQKAQQGQ